MAVTFNPFTGNLDFVGSGGGSTSPGGSDTQIQFNDDGDFGGDAGLVFNKSTNKLTAGGDIELNDGGANTLTLQTVTPTAARTISFPDATGTVGLVAGSTSQFVYNNAGAYAGLSTLTTDGTNVTLTGRFISSLNGAASAPPGTFTGTWFTGGTATTTKPQVLIEPSGATSTAWSTSGTGFGVNAASGFAGNLLDLQVNGTSQFAINNGGRITGTSLALNSVGTNDPGALGIGTSATSTLAGYTGAGSVAWVSSVFGVGFIVPSDAGPIGFSSAARTSVSSVASSKDTLLYRDAAGSLAQRNGTNAQKTRVYDTYTSDTDYHRVTIATARATLTDVSGASVTATGLIPAGAVVMGVTSKVTTALGTANGTTGYKIGTGADDDRWGAITGTAAGTTSDNRNWTAGTIECFPTATDVIVTATGGNFDATGVIYLSVQYMAGEAD
jgi:hypothetical protein